MSTSKDVNIFEEFLDFFNNLLNGYTPEDEDENNEVLNIIQSESTMESISLKLNTVFKKLTNTIEQNVYANQKITIDCGRDKLTDWHLKPMGQKYTWYGAEIPNTKCIKYGCCYDVTQTANISLSAINQTESSDHLEMWNTIQQEMVNQVHLTLGKNSRTLTALNSALNKLKVKSISNIKKILENASSIDVESGQGVKIIALSPLRCKNKCTEPASAGFVEQGLNVQIAIDNMISDITKSVTETYITMVSRTSSTISNVDMKKIYIFAAFSCLLIITIFIISYIIVYIVLLKGRGPEIVGYVGATVLTIIILMFWSIILCLIRARGKTLKSVFCMFR